MALFLSSSFHFIHFIILVTGLPVNVIWAFPPLLGLTLSFCFHWLYYVFIHLSVLLIFFEELTHFELDSKLSHKIHVLISPQML